MTTHTVPFVSSSLPEEKDEHTEFLQQTLEQASDAVVAIDEHNHVILFNRAAENLWNWPREQVLGRNVNMLMPPDIRDVHDGYVNANRATGVNHVAGTARDVAIQRRDGSWRWASLSLSRVVIGARVLYTGFLHDVTDQRTEQHYYMRQLALAADHSGGALLVVDSNMRITYANAGFTRLLGYEPSEMLGCHPIKLLCGACTDPHTINAVRETVFAGRELLTQALLYTRTGHSLWVSALINPVCGPTGALENVVAMFVDITHTQMPEELRYKVLDAMVHDMPLGDIALLLCREIERIAPEVTASLVEVDADNRLRVLAAPSLPLEIVRLIDGVPIGPQAICGGAAAATGKPALCADISADPHWAGVHEAFVAQGLLSCWSNPIQTRNGVALGALTLYYREPRKPDALHKRLADVGLHLCAPLLERERERTQIHYLAYYDALTGLANRSLLRAQLERSLHETQRNKTPLALMFIDLDHFKQINDTLGHPAGDALLRAVASRLQDGARAGDVVARLGGDEFVLVLPRCNAAQAVTATNRLLGLLNQPVEVDGATLNPNASVGLAMYPEDAPDGDTLLRCADTAMYQAKAAGGQCYRFYSAEMDQQAQERLTLEADLRQALRDGGLALNYQPQMSGATLHSVEALLRWTHPRLGAIAPLRLVKIAKESCLLDALTQWVLDKACRQMADWRARNVVVPRMAVNLPDTSFLDPALPARLEKALAAHHLPPQCLTVEITETIMQIPNPSGLETARAVRETGIELSLDNFGAGHAGLDTLHRLPIDELKLDKSYVQELETSSVARALTASVLHIARELDVRVVAEGVETQAQQQFLSANGCNVFQGYLLSHPLTAEGLEAWLKAQTLADAAVADAVSTASAAAA